ncbi:MAG: hypothetical protein H2056_02925, partial [Sphingopyxis sp.]|nr:hypothetical protein [Sphingopyxis sp.]
MDAAQAVHEKFLARLTDGRLPDRSGLPDPAAVGLDAATLADIYETQLTTRQMDRLSRTLQARGERGIALMPRRPDRVEPLAARLQG